jgi:hypothetical protein
MPISVGQLGSILRLKFQRKVAFACFLAIPILFLSQAIWAGGADKSKFFHVEGQSQWKEISPAALADYSNRVRQQTGQAVEYMAGYTLTPGKKELELPFILVMSAETGKLPEKKLADITRSIGQNDFQKKLKEKGAGLPPIQAGSMTYEEARRIVWIEIVARPPGQGQLNVITASKLIETGALNFILYAPMAEKDLHLRAFNDFLNHVIINPDLQYRSEQKLAQQANMMASILFDIVLAVLIIGLASWPAIALNRKMLAKSPGRRSFAWGYFLALGTILIGILTAVIGIADDSSRGMLITWGILLCLLGTLLYRRNRWAWLTFVILGLNPGAWIINGLYLRNRWQEMRDDG